MVKPISILLVDDDPKNLMVLETILNASDYRLVKATTADAALMALMQEEFAAIVLDVQMPEMSGIDLAKLIKQRKKTQHIPILLLTAYYQEDEHVMLGYGAGAVDYITKPVNPAVLRSKVGVFIDLFRKTQALEQMNRQMEAEIEERQKAEERFRLVVESAPSAMVVMALDGRITLVNSRTETLFGYERGALLGQSVKLLVPEGFPKIEGTPAETGKVEGLGVRQELVGLRKDGSSVPIEVGLSLFESADGVFNLASFVDVTERNHAEAALRSANVELAAKNTELRRQADDRALRIRAEAAKAEADAARERSAFLDEASTILAAAFDDQMTLQTLARLIVPRLADCCVLDVVDESGLMLPLVVAHRDPELEHRVREFRFAFPTHVNEDDGVAGALKTGGTQVCEDTATGKGTLLGRSPQEREAIEQLGFGSYMIIPLVARGRTLGALYLASGKAHHFQAYDRALSEELAQRAALALDNARLYHEAQLARQGAEAANSAKDRFLAMLSHELRTPLSPVLHAVALLEEDESCAPSLRNTLETIRRNVQLEARLIDDLLDLARIRNGKLQLQLEPTDVHDLVNRAVDICQPDIAQRGLKVSSRLNASRRRLHADPARIQQIFWNLLSNAVKYTPPGGTIEITTEDAADPNGVCIEVTDSGIGIEAERVDSIFGAFEQAHGQRSSGLGLGLAICRALAEMHGGKITARSPGAGQGTTFSLLLPASALPVEAPRPAQELKEKASTKLRLLLVEDHADTAATLQRLLVRRGYSVQSAETVRGAVGLIDQGEFDVLVSDIGLPDGSGLEVMRKFAEASGSRPVAGIALSGFGMPEDIARSKLAGFTEHLTKPVDISLLQQTLRRLDADLALEVMGSGSSS